MTDPRVIDVRDVAPKADAFDSTRDRLDSTTDALDSMAHTLDAIVDHVQAGGLLAYPTETVYGFGGLPTPSAIERIVALKGRGAKGREPAKPILLLVLDRESVTDLTWTPEAIALADVFWPGSVTLVLADPLARYPEGVRGPEGNVAVRVSPHPLVGELVRRLGSAILSTSANRPGEPPALDAPGALGAAIAAGAGEELWVLDGGILAPSPPSTIIDCSGSEPLVLRQGTIPLGRVRCVLPDVQAASRMSVQ